MITEAILIACITAAASVICQIMISNRAANLMQYRIDKLEEKVNKHNNLVERIAIAERDLKTAFRLIDEGKEENHGR